MRITIIHPVHGRAQCSSEQINEMQEGGWKDQASATDEEKKAADKAHEGNAAEGRRNRVAKDKAKAAAK